MSYYERSNHDLRETLVSGSDLCRTTPRQRDELRTGSPAKVSDDMSQDIGREVVMGSARPV